MATPTVTGQGTSATTTAGTSHTVSIGSPANGTRVIVIFAYAVTGQTITWPAGWTPITNAKTELTTSDTQGQDAAYRDCDGTEGATITVGTSANTKADHQYFKITGHDTAIAPEATTGVTGTGANPDPPTVTPTGGSKDYLFIATASCAGEDSISAYPSSYINTQTSNSGTAAGVGTNCFSGSATRAVTGTSENPGTFTRITGAGDGWVAQTFAIHPAGVSLDGTLFTSPPTFFTGAISVGAVNLSGSLFTNPPAFFTGAISSVLDLAGVLFANGTTFFTGTVTSTRDLAGVLFTNPPTFFTGTIAAGAVNLAGILFTNPPSFPPGAISQGPGGTQSLTGTLYAHSSTFFVGTVSGAAAPIPMVAPARARASLRIEVWSLPDDPDGFRLLCEPPYLNGTGFQDRADVYGGGQLIVPSDYEHLALIVDVDPSDIEASHSSITRALQWWPDDESPDGGIWQVVWEFFNDEAEEQIQDGQRVVSITGLDVRSAPDDGIVYPREPTAPNWQWGAPNLLENPGFEDSALTSAAFKITIDATAGTWTLTMSAFGTTSAIDWDVDAPTLAIAIEAVSGIQDVTVAGDGSTENPFIVEFLDPANTDIGTVSTNSGSLTGLASPEVITVGGAPSILPWTRSFNPSTGLFHGTYNYFGPSTEHVRSGSWSLKVDGDLGAWPGSWPGAMQIVNVGEGDHWGTPYVWPSVDARYRFGLRTIDDTWLATIEADLEDGATGGWQSVPLYNVDFPPYVGQVIWRVACISNNHGDAVFWLDDNMLAPGFPATTWGEILGILVEEAFARGDLPWLTRDFDEFIDSDGVTWDTDEFAFQADALMQLGTHVIHDGESAGYEHDITPIDQPPGGFDPGDDTHILHAYNPQGRGDNSMQALVVGAFQTGRVAKRRMPYTVLLLEMNDGTFVEFVDPRLAAFPRRERGVRVEQANDATTAYQIADAIFDKEIAGLMATQITLSGESVLPYRDFDIGWIVPHSLGSRALKHDRRVQIIASSYQSNQWVYVVTAAGVVIES